MNRFTPITNSLDQRNADHEMMRLHKTLSLNNLFETWPGHLTADLISSCIDRDYYYQQCKCINCQDYFFVALQSKDLRTPKEIYFKEMLHRIKTSEMEAKIAELSSKIDKLSRLYDDKN